MKSALIILNAQNRFFAGDNPNAGAYEATIPTINAAMAVFRQQRRMVVFLQHTADDMPYASKAWQIDPRFLIKPTDTRLSKMAENAFWNTGLDTLLRSQRIDRVVIAGFAAERDVLSSLRGAVERGYEALLLEGGIAGPNNRYTQFTLEISGHIRLEGLAGNI